MSGATYQWVGTAGDFSDASNWEYLGGVGGAEGDAPGSDDYAIIGVGTAGGVNVTASMLQVDYEVYLNAVMDADSVDVGQRTVSGFTVGGKLYVSGGPGTLTTSSIVVDGGTGSEQATITVDGAANGPYTPGAAAIVSTGALVVGETGFGSFNEGLGFANAPAPGNVTVNGPLVVSDQAGSDGSVGLQDETSVLTLNGSVTIGNAGNGGLSASGGTTLNANGQIITIGSDAGSNGVLGVGGDIIDFTGETTQTFYPGSTLTAAGIIVGDAGNGRLTIYEAQATVPGTIVLGDQATGYGLLDLIGGGSGPLAQLSVGDLLVGNEGTGVVNVESGAILDAQTIMVGVSGVASFLVDGASSEFDTGDLTVGDETPTATNDQGNPDGTDGDWAYAGDTGTLTASDSAAVTAGQTLTLLAFAQINGSGTTVTQGGIDVSSGGDIEIGGTSGAPANSLQIDNGGLLVGHGLVNSPITNYDTMTGAALYSLDIDNKGTIEAKDGLLDLDGNITGDGTALIDSDAALEIGGTIGTATSPAGTIDFQDATAGTLIIDNIDGFSATLGGLYANDPTQSTDTTTGTAEETGAFTSAATIANTPTVGSQLVLHSTNPANGTGVVAATIGLLNGQLELQIAKGSNILGAAVTPLIPIAGTTAAITHNFFQVSQSGTNTVLTYAKGNPIDLATNGPMARQTYSVTGIGVTVGIISGFFGSDAQIANDQSLQALPADVEDLQDYPGSDDEGRAMAQIVHDIAPGANIDFYSAVGPDPNLSSPLGLLNLGITDATVANAIQQLVSAGCQVIVDDVSIHGEPLTGSATETAINSAVKKGVTYVTFAGNNSGPVVGHSADPMAITVGAINWLATPTSIGGYLPTQTESYSSQGSASIIKPNVVAPDGGPTTFPLDINGPAAVQTDLSPFFGTSASAPVVAGVAALMLQASNYQLKPSNISSDIQLTTTSIGASYTQGGAGLVNAYQAVGLAKSGAYAFYVDPPVATLDVASAYLSQPNGDADAGAALQFLLTMSAGVTVTGGTPTLILNDGGTAVYDPNASDPGNASLVFDYTVGSTDIGSNLAIIGYAPNGAIVQDASADVADFSGLFNVPTGLSINSPLQVIGTGSSRQGEVQTGATVELTITLNNSLTVDTGGGVPTLTLDNNAIATYDPAESNLSDGTLVFDYVVGTADAISYLSIGAVNVPVGSTIQDSNGDNADFSAALSQSLSLQVEPTFVNLFAISQTGAIETGQTAQLTLTMTEPVIVNTGSGSPTLTLTDGDIATYDTAASNPSTGTLVFDDIVASGDQTPDLQIAQFNPNGATIQDTHGVAVDLSGALDDPSGLTVNSPLDVTSVTSAQIGTATIGQTITIALAMNEAADINAADSFGELPYLVLNDGEFAAYDTINSTSTILAFDYTVQPGDFTPDLTVTGVNTNGAAVRDALGNNADFTAAMNAPTGVDVVACFAAGTPIRTPRGEVQVEHLREGDCVATVLGRGAQPIVWIGRRSIDCSRHPRPRNVWPVRIRAHAFGSGRPSHDLFLSPDHAVFVLGSLAPVKYLINGVSIAQVPRDSITYYHLELSSHDVVFAAGLPVESYLDTGDRGKFSNAPGAVALHPDFAARVREAEGCAPLIITGPELEAVCHQLRNPRGNPRRLSPPAPAMPRRSPRLRCRRT